MLWHAMVQSLEKGGGFSWWLKNSKQILGYFRMTFLTKKKKAYFCIVVALNLPTLHCREKGL